MRLVQSYLLSNVNLLVKCHDQQISQKVIETFDDCFFLEKAANQPNFPRLTLRYKNNNFTSKTPESAKQLVCSASLCVLKNGNVCYLLKGNSVFQLELAKSIGTGFIDADFWKIPPKSKQEFFMLSLLWLLRPNNIYALHANGIVKDGIGFLFVGGTGSGKSTTAISLIRQGWEFLSDDVTLLRSDSKKIEAMAFVKGFSIDPQLASRCPELRGLEETSSWNESKIYINTESLYPDQFLSCCLPKVLIFPKIVSRRKSKLLPVDWAKALILLIENSGGIMLDKNMADNQIKVLKQLIYQTSSYQLLAGLDLYKEPEKISEIISQLL
jgi:hypothetical protein